MLRRACFPGASSLRGGLGGAGGWLSGPGGTAPHTLTGSGVEAGLSPLCWGVAALACRPRLTCGAAMCARPTFCTSAQRQGWVTRDHKLFHHMEARPARASNLFTHTARALAPPSASANEVGLGGGCGLAVLLICLRHQGGWGLSFFRVSGWYSCSDSVEYNHIKVVLPSSTA